VGVAGVATNLLIAVIFALITRYAVASGMGAFANATATISFVNLFLGLFNLLPIPPIDGYTVLRGILPFKYSMAFRNFENRMRQGGLFTLVIVLFAFSYFFAGPFSMFVQWVFAILIGA
jgi:Zn-dependent protease